MKRVAANFVAEQQLTPALHEQFLRELAVIWTADSGNADWTFGRYASVCQNYQLRGPSMSGTPVTRAGHVSAYDTFRFYLQKNLTALGVSSSVTALEIEIRALANEFTLDVTLGRRRASRLFRNIQISDTPAWGTFVNPARNTSPYVPPRDNATSICENYGLGKIDPPRELVALTYLPKMALFCPSIADAGTDPFFKPVPAGSAHGFTKPLNRFLPFGTSQPEAVHGALDGTLSELTFETFN